MIYDEFSIKSKIKTILDWPEPGVAFRDLSPIFQDPKSARLVIDTLVQRYIDAPITHIAALDARGFLLGGSLAYTLNKPLVMVRKAGKLPGEVDAVEYDCEYAKGRLEILKDSVTETSRVLIVDDLIATGGTILAASHLLQKQGARIEEVAAIIDLADLGGRVMLNDNNLAVFSLCTLEGHR